MGVNISNVVVCSRRVYEGCARISYPLSENINGVCLLVYFILPGKSGVCVNFLWSSANDMRCPAVPYRIQRCMSHTPEAVFQAPLLDNQEGANTERYVRLRKALGETLLTPTFWAPSLF